MALASEKTVRFSQTDNQHLFTSEDFAGLKLARYRIRLRAEEEALIPPFPGSTLRGTFGYALKQAVCVMSHRDCGRCLVASKCIYPYVFETPMPPGIAMLRKQQNAPHPFVLDPPIYCRSGTEMTENADRWCGPRWENHQLAIGEEIAFGLTLMGQAINHLPYLVYAVHEMAQRGIGKGRARFTLFEVSSVETAGTLRPIYCESSQRLDAQQQSADLSELVADRHAQWRANNDGGQSGDPPGSRCESLKLRFLTPTRIKTHDELQPQADFALLIRNLLRRISMLMAVHGECRMELDFRKLLERSAAISTQSSSLRWWDWERYSGRQQTKMKLGGFVGEVTYLGEYLAEFIPLLIAGELLRVGNGTSFGLGRFDFADFQLSADVRGE